MLLIRNGATANQIRIDTGLGVLKPLVVEWLMQSWNKLKGMKRMIIKGWQKVGLDKMMDPATQEEARDEIGAGRLSLNDESGIEDDGTSAADLDDIIDEMNLDEDDNPEDDEEEIDAEVCLAALIEDRPVTGLRRSSRIQGLAAQNLDSQIARIMQECILDDHIYMRER
jgi:hypothetical protein